MSEGDPTDPAGIDPASSHPRRAAHADFAVEASANDVAAVRAAMNPANQSLADALKLSYRLLQFAIAGLVVAFLFSGFQTVQEGYTGVRTVFGAIEGAPGEEALSPGLQPFWPYPVGQVVAFEQKRVVDLRNEFWFRSKGDQITLDQATEGADTTQPIRPGVDGSLITADGDLAHVQLVVEYGVADPVQLVRSFDWERRDALVRLAVRAAVVQTAAQLTLVELLEQRDLPAQMVRERAQAQLDRMQSGLQLASVQMPERIAPLAVRNAVQAVQAAREDAKTMVEKARQDANTRLLAAAGPRYGEILDMIAAYEVMLAQIDPAKPGTKQAADAKLAEIGRRLEQPDIGGVASRTVSRGRAYQVQVETSLGAEQRRLASLAPSFRENPRQLVRQLWLEALRDTLTSPTAEVFSVPQGTGSLDVAIKSANDIMQARRNAELERKKLEAQMLGAQDPAFQLGSRQIMIDKAGRRLEKDGKKGFAQP